VCPPETAASFQQMVAHHHFSVGLVLLFLHLVLFAAASLRGASRVFALLQEQLGFSLGMPHWSTGRLWILRLGHYKLTRPKVIADDWVWLVDHSNQIGQEKCLVILGIRLCDLPPPGECLRHEHLEPIEILPVTKSNGQVVCDQLEANIAKTGVPRAIIKDDGNDLTAGANLFCQRHPQTCQIYDIKHQVALMLRDRLEKDPTWSSFNRQLRQSKVQVQQTELAFLAPPGQRPKARYMNVETLVSWGQRTLEVVDHKPPQVMALVTAPRLEEKLGWLREYRQPLSRWSAMFALTTAAEDFVRRQGLYQGAKQDLAQVLAPLAEDISSREMADALVEFVAQESANAHANERLPGTTEVLESCFGKLKALEHDQCKSGFTGMVLSLAATVSATTASVVHKALESTCTREVLKWCKDKIGPTVQAKRRLAYQLA